MYVGLVFLDSKEHFLYHGKLQTFLFILSSYIAVVAPVIMAVIAGVYAFSADARMCTSELHWKRWFQYKDEEVIRSIQESFRCCGFNSMRDRAWPFPSRDTDAGACQRTSGFRTHCGPLWEDQLQVTARLCLMASVLLHLLLVSLSHLCFRFFTAQDWFRSYFLPEYCSIGSRARSLHRLVHLANRRGFWILLSTMYRPHLLEIDNSIQKRLCLDKTAYSRIHTSSLVVMSYGGSRELPRLFLAFLFSREALR